MTDAGEPLSIDVVSDVVCPWCYLGEKRLAAALAEETEPVDVRWRPYQLDPTIPDGGLDRKEYMERKFGRDGRLNAVHDQLVQLGAEVGLPFAFDRIARAPNTLDAHRLIRWAASTGAARRGGRPPVPRLFRRGARHRRPRRAARRSRARAASIRRSSRACSTEGADVEAVRSEIAQAQAIGVTGVPFFIFAGRLGVPGAQDVSVLRRAIAEARGRGADAAGGLSASGRVERQDEFGGQFDGRGEIVIAVEGRRSATIGTFASRIAGSASAASSLRRSEVETSGAGPCP